MVSTGVVVIGNVGCCSLDSLVNRCCNTAETQAAEASCRTVVEESGVSGAWAFISPDVRRSSLSMSLCPSGLASTFTPINKAKLGQFANVLMSPADRHTSALSPTALLNAVDFADNEVVVPYPPRWTEREIAEDRERGQRTQTIGQDCVALTRGGH